MVLRTPPCFPRPRVTSGSAPRPPAPTDSRSSPANFRQGRLGTIPIALHDLPAVQLRRHRRTPCLGDKDMPSGNIKLAMSHVVPDLVQKVLKGQIPCISWAPAIRSAATPTAAISPRASCRPCSIPRHATKISISPRPTTTGAGIGQGDLGKDQRPGQKPSTTSPIRRTLRCAASRSGREQGRARTGMKPRPASRHARRSDPLDQTRLALWPHLMNQRDATPRYSVVVPVFNEAETSALFFRGAALRIAAELRAARLLRLFRQTPPRRRRRAPRRKNRPALRRRPQHARQRGPLCHRSRHARRRAVVVVMMADVSDDLPRSTKWSSRREGRRRRRLRQPLHEAAASKSAAPSSKHSSAAPPA